MKAKGDMWKGKKAWDVSATSKRHIVRKSCHFSLRLFHFASPSYIYAHAHIAFLSWWTWDGRAHRERERESTEKVTQTLKNKKRGVFDGVDTRHSPLTASFFSAFMSLTLFFLEVSCMLQIYWITTGLLVSFTCLSSGKYRISQYNNA